MEHTLCSLAFKGSIPEAISEAKKQMKLFVVYISGENDASNQLEETTWMDSNVADSVSKYCILLHICDGSPDAANFSAIYPQKSIPCIAVIGYNGVQLWQNDGLINAKDLVSNLEKAWLSLHLQQTTASVLSAALASREYEPSSIETSNSAPSNEASSSDMSICSPSVEMHVQPPVDCREFTTEMEKENKGLDCAVQEKTAIAGYETPSKSLNADKTRSAEEGKSASPATAAQGNLDSDVTEMKKEGVFNTSVAECLVSDNMVNPLSIQGRDSNSNDKEEIDSAQNEKEKALDDEKADAIDKHEDLRKSSDVHLNIRLPNGVSLQEKFSVVSTLRMVKDFVDESQESGVGSYDIAIPYPRKVFTEEDLSKSFLELGLFDRQALIMVPHRKANQDSEFSPSTIADSRATVNSSIGSAGGYFGYLGTMLSYLNPLSYFGSASHTNSGEEPEIDMWEYSPNSAHHDNHTNEEEPYYSSYQSNQNNSATSRNKGRNRGPSSSRFGSNIHTLRDVEDDSPSSDRRNTFWNGNSTQYGGDDDRK